MKIYVGNLSDEIGKKDLQSAFKEYGKVTSVKIKKDAFTGKSKGYAFVIMLSPAEAEAAIKGLDGSEIKGQKLKVGEARSDTQQWKSIRRRNHGGPF